MNKVINIVISAVAFLVAVMLANATGIDLVLIVVFIEFGYCVSSIIKKETVIEN